jgi:hypothetical protein
LVVLEDSLAALVAGHVVHFLGAIMCMEEAVLTAEGETLAGIIGLTYWIK